MFRGEPMITGVQIRSARGALRWSSQDLAKQSGVGARTIKRLEQFDCIPPGRTETLSAIKRAFEAAYIEFIGGPNECPGIRLTRWAL